MKQAIKLGVICALLFSGTMLGVEAASLKKVVSPRSNSRLSQTEAAPKREVLSQAGCVIPNSGGSGGCDIPDNVRSALSAELA